MGTYLDDSLMDAAQAGSVVVVLQNATTRFKQAWWLGNSADNNAGTLVFKDNTTQKILGGMAPDGYADQSWYHMIEKATTFLLDKETLPADWVFSPPTIH